MRRHLTCAGGGLAGLVLGLALVAHAQVPAHETADASILDYLLPEPVVAFVREFGLPGVLALLGWWARGVTLKGVPIVVTLADEDRAELRRARRVLERHLSADDSDSGDPPAPKAA